MRRRISRTMGRRAQVYKHVVDNEANGDFSAAVTTVDLIVGTDNPTLGNTTNVEARARIASLYLELHYTSINPAPPINYNSLHWLLYYSPQGQIAGSGVNPAGTGAVSSKAYIFKQGMIDIDNLTQRTGKVAGVILIPRKYGTIMNTDKIRLAFILQHFNGASFDVVGIKCIYKEIRS